MEKDYEHPLVIWNIGPISYEQFLDVGDKKIILKHEKDVIIVPGYIIDFKYRTSERDPSISVSKIRTISEEDKESLERVIREKKGFQGKIVYGNG